VLPVPFAKGWIYLNLNTTVAQAGSNPPEDPAMAQAWVIAVQDAGGRFSLSHPATNLDSAVETTHTPVGN